MTDWTAHRNERREIELIQHIRYVNEYKGTDNLDQVMANIERLNAVRDLLMAEEREALLTEDEAEEEESALVDELVEAGWPVSFGESQAMKRAVVRRILAAQKRRAES